MPTPEHPVVSGAAAAAILAKVHDMTPATQAAIERAIIRECGGDEDRARQAIIRERANNLPFMRES